MSQSIIEDIDTSLSGNAKIKVIGVGGGGGNAIQEMINEGLGGVHYICANTDLQALTKNQAQTKVQLGEKLTRGLGAGANPTVGREAAAESINGIRDAIGNADMVFVTAGLGGGTGTGAAPVVAQVAKELNALTVAVVTKPFSFEGKKRMKIAESGLEELKKYADCLIVIPNDRLVNTASKKVTVPAMMQKANEVLRNGIKSISDVIRQEGYVNTDFADVKTTMAQSGLALMGTGRASGDNRAREATQQAISSPLLEDVSLESAKAILYNVTGSPDNFTMDEMTEIGNMINEAVGDDSDIHIIFGLVYDEAMGEELQVTIIATGIEPVSCLEEDPLPKQATITSFHKPQMQAPRESRRIPLRPQQQVPYDDVADPMDPRENGYGAQGYGVRRQPAAPDNLGRYARKFDAVAQGRGVHTPGQPAYTYDEEDYEMPSFLRHQAD